MPKSTAPHPGNQPLPAVHALGHPSSPPPRTSWDANAKAQVVHTAAPHGSAAAHGGAHGGGHGGHAGAPSTAAAPAAPGAPVVVPVSGTSLAVSWVQPATDAAHGIAATYNLRYSLAGAGVWTVVAGVSSIYTLGGLAASTAYDVQIQAANPAGASAWSATATATTAGLAPNAPAAPVVAQASATTLTVTWTAPSASGSYGAAAGYNLRYSPSGAGNWTVVAGVTSVCTLTGLTAATAYDVQVQATNAGGSSAWSGTGTATTAALTPNAPAIASVVAPPDGTVTKLAVTWSTPSADATHSAATGFDLRYSPSGAGSWTTVTGVTSPYTITGLSGASAIDVQVRATNTAGGPGAWSPLVTGQTWGATVAQGAWVPASTQTHGASTAPNGGAQMFAVAAPTSVSGAAFAWSASNTTVPASGLIAAGADGQTNGWGQWFNAPASAGTYYLWLLAQGTGGTAIGALVTGPVTVS